MKWSVALAVIEGHLSSSCIKVDDNKKDALEEKEEAMADTTGKEAEESSAVEQKVIEDLVFNN